MFLRLWHGQSSRAGTQSFVLITDDPDAIPVAGYTWDHWIVSDNPASATALPENDVAFAAGRISLPEQSRESTHFPASSTEVPVRLRELTAITSNCMPVFLATLNPANTDKTGIEAAMSGHLLGQTELVGTYTVATRKR